jgi:hypothetical protein
MNDETSKKKTMPWWGWALIALLVVGVITNLSDGEGPDESSQTASEPAETAEEERAVVESEQPEVEVPWEDYDASVKLEIDELAAQNDCEGLQEQFDIADANNEATMSRTGHNNAQLMAYIDQKLQAASCY